MFTRLAVALAATASVGCALVPAPKNLARESKICREQLVINSGRFDACYFPAEDLLRVELRVAFTFDSIEAPEERLALERFVIESAGRAWSGHHFIEVPSFEGPRRVGVEVRLVKSEDPHFGVLITHELVQSHVMQLHLGGGIDAFNFRRATLSLGQGPERDLEVVAHEVGHMLGLGDEYEGGKPLHRADVRRFTGQTLVIATDDRVMSSGLRIDDQHGVGFAMALTRILVRNGIRVIPGPPTTLAVIERPEDLERGTQ